ncbi:MAG TPA: IscS subfamily cysteine desulfurase, partial [Acetobacteraceae bacterium]|nr:IscS subfamily cysteine desulfurase [Acetobacteraceae bacterium]
ARLEMDDDKARIAALRERLLARLGVPVTINGSTAHRIAGNLNLTFPAPALELMRAVPELCVSTGSACSSAEVEPSYVLRALGLDEAQAACTLRIGLGRFTSAADVDFAADALSEAARAAQDLAGADV